MDNKERNEAVEAAKNETSEANLDAPREVPNEVMEYIAGGRPEIHKPPMD